MFVYALTAPQFANNLLEEIVDPLVAMMAFIALLFLIIKTIKYIRNPGDSANRINGLKGIGYSVFGIFIIFSIWTIFIFIGKLADSDITRELEKHRVEFDEYELIQRKNVNLNRP